MPHRMFIWPLLELTWRCVVQIVLVASHNHAETACDIEGTGDLENKIFSLNKVDALNTFTHFLANLMVRSRVMHFSDTDPQGILFSHVCPITGTQPIFTRQVFSATRNIKKLDIGYIPINYAVADLFLRERGVEKHRLSGLMHQRIKVPLPLCVWTIAHTWSWIKTTVSSPQRSATESAYTGSHGSRRHLETLYHWGFEQQFIQQVFRHFLEATMVQAIVKVQRPITSSEDIKLYLVYDELRTYLQAGQSLARCIGRRLEGVFPGHF